MTSFQDAIHAILGETPFQCSKFCPINSNSPEDHKKIKCRQGQPNNENIILLCPQVLRAAAKKLDMPNKIF